MRAIDRALADVLRDVYVGVEYPDAEARACLKHGVSSDKLRQAYDDHQQEIQREHHLHQPD